MFLKLRGALVVSTLLLTSASLVGCAGEDRRLVSDQQSCQSMGHTPNTPAYQQCMRDLNERRCAVQRGKAGAGTHVATSDCTQLP